MLHDEKIMPSDIINVLQKTTLQDIHTLLHIIKKGDLFVNMVGSYINK